MYTTIPNTTTVPQHNPQYYMRSLLQHLEQKNYCYHSTVLPRCDEGRNFNINYQFHMATSTSIADNTCDYQIPVIFKSFTDTAPPPNSNFHIQYRYYRTREWLETAQTSLFDRLQPGFAKSQRLFPLGSLQLDYFLDFMMQFRCSSKLGVSYRRTFKDEELVSVPHIFFQFTIVNGLPPLLDSSWHCKDRSESYEIDTAYERYDHVKSMFTKITFFINTENNKIDCHFMTESFRLVNSATQEWMQTF